MCTLISFSHTYPTTICHLSIFFLGDYIHFSSLYYCTTDSLGIQSFLPVELPYPVYLYPVVSTLPSLTCTTSVFSTSISSSISHSKMLAWNLSHPWSFLYHPEVVGDEGNNGGYLNLNFLYAWIPFVSSPLDAYHCFCSYPYHVT